MDTEAVVPLAGFAGFAEGGELFTQVLALGRGQRGEITVAQDLVVAGGDAPAVGALATVDFRIASCRTGNRPGAPRSARSGTHVARDARLRR